MKLVDILARELKEWPEGIAAIAQGGITCELYDSSFQLIEPGILVSPAEDRGNPEVMPGAVRITRPEWQAAVDALKAAENALPHWTGEGLPPVGTHVAVHDDGSLVYGRGESGEVLAHVDGCAVIRMSYGLGCFLPRCLRTPEQIAAEEREQAVHAMGATVKQPPGSVTYGALYDLYDAGYRKLETVDN